MLYGCPKNDNCFNSRPLCIYEYPVNTKNLKDTIKTTDTIWVENDHDAYFCLSEAVKNGIGGEYTYFEKLINDTFVTYVPFMINYTEKRYNGLNGKHEGYNIMFNEQNGRYKSKYGIVFSDTGIYSFFFRPLTEITYGRGCRVELAPYFNTSSNNTYLLPKKLQEKPDYSLNKPYYYRTYFFAVVE